MGRWSDYLAATGAAILTGRQRRIRESAASAFEHRELLQYGVAAQLLRQEGRQRVLAFEECSQVLAQRLWVDRRLRLSHDQRKLAQAMRNTMLLRWYVGIQNVMADRQWLRETLGVTSINDFIICKWPRRRGKTLVQTFVAACTAASQPSGNVLAFCPVVDQARTWLNQVEGFLTLLKDHPRFGWTEESKISGKSIKIRSTYNRTAVSVIKAYGNGTNAKFAQNLRGTGNDVMLVEIDEGFFFVDAAYEVILPVLANGAAGVLVSSMPIAENGGYKLTQIKYKTGRPVATTIDWRPGCADCRALEERTRQEIVCRHEPQKVLPFRSKTYEMRLAAMMKPFGDSYAREIQNMGGGATAVPIFDPVQIDAAIGPQATDVITDVGDQNHFIVTCDPGSTLRRSDTAIAALLFTRNLPMHEPRPGPTPLHGYCVVRCSTDNCRRRAIRARRAGVSRTVAGAMPCRIRAPQAMRKSSAPR